MISSVRGTVLSALGSTAVVEVGGVGLAITVTPTHALTLRVGSETMLRTALVVREDDLSLYGFATAEELDVFDLLRGVSGVGPKSAMGVLGSLTPHEIATAVSSENDAAFRAVSGIGPKTAKLIVVSLAGKLTVTLPGGSTPTSSPRTTVAEDVTVALVGLGWPERVAANAVDQVIADAIDSDRESVPALLRRALAALGARG